MNIQALTSTKISFSRNIKSDNKERYLKIPPDSRISEAKGFKKSKIKPSYPLNYYVKDLKTSASRFYKPQKFDGTLSPECFYIRMNFYQKNKKWAQEMVETTKTLSSLMKQDVDFPIILQIAENSVSKMNHNLNYGARRSIEGSAAPYFPLLRKGRGEEYVHRYEEKLGTQDTFYPVALGKHAFDTNTVEVTHFDMTGAYIIQYPYLNSTSNSNLNIAKEIYDELKTKKNPSKEEVMAAVAKIQWYIAQETPYLKGSDSIANLITKAIMYSYDLPISPLKAGISLDFEAFYQHLHEYVKNYPSYFEINPIESQGQK